MGAVKWWVGARLMGALFMLPLPLAVVAAVLLALLFGKAGSGYVMGIEFLLVLVAL